MPILRLHGGISQQDLEGKPMILEGSIERFGLASVLQFLAQSSATGVLEVRDSLEHGFVYLVDGHVEGISLPVTDDLLGTRLVKAGCLTGEQLHDALIEDASLTPGQRRMRPLGQRLVEKGLISEASVRKVMQRQVLDEVFELAHWRAGVFIYDEPPVMPAFRVKILGNVQGLLSNVQQRLDHGDRAFKASVKSAKSEVCLACPLENDCSDAIKAKYLKQDVCLWRKMTAVLDERDGRFNDAIAEGPDAVLDTSICWRP
jgi:hypothetical protein